MSGNDELRSLRERAYAKDSDIHLDPAALERLHALEAERLAETRADAARAEVERAEAARRDATMREVAVDAAEDAGALDWDVTDDVEEVEPDPFAVRAARMLRRLRDFLVGLQRSTVLIAVGSALLIATLVTSLVLIQRVQVDPLQTGAPQVARLSVDPGYEVPAIFAGAPVDESGRAPYAFEEFNGLRIVNAVNFFSSYSDESCLIIFPAANVVDDDQQGFTGPTFYGCSAGAFPAIVQITSDSEGLPDELAEAFPAGTGLQFVWDEDHDEIVVFAG